ncbi:hypothetical protein [Corallococcus sp. AB038B]|uniref:hypothetical protein n=1 Tax=Corallococcus sp. AB038B TaxID=2316718 RepID=UPI000EDEE2CA|nr:hypothetical protein [Corallococcus sp. AB038B]RKH92981.1 hypothetical protein D7Y04_41910 [Corallococcus sp. AB038B]
MSTKPPDESDDGSSTKDSDKKRRNTRQVGFRLTKEEKRLVADACIALGGGDDPDAKISAAQLFTTAGIEEAASLGFTTSSLDSRKPKFPPGVWKNRPERSYSSLHRAEEKETLTITIHPLHRGPIALAADHVEVKLPTFLWGSLMAFLARRKAAEPSNTLLQQLDLPSQYRQPR